HTYSIHHYRFLYVSYTLLHPPPRSTLFPYTTLFRSSSLLDNFESILRDYLNTIEDNDYLLDALKSRGEDFNAQLISAYFNSLGISAKYVSPEEAGIRVTNTPANARLLPTSYNEINKLKDYPEDVLVIPGFYGIADNGNIVTFARGGSDITGAIIARGIRAD